MLYVKTGDIDHVPSPIYLSKAMQDNGKFALVISCSKSLRDKLTSVVGITYGALLNDGSVYDVWYSVNVSKLPIAGFTHTTGETFPSIFTYSQWEVDSAADPTIPPPGTQIETVRDDGLPSVCPYREGSPKCWDDFSCPVKGVEDVEFSEIISGLGDLKSMLGSLDLSEMKENLKSVKQLIEDAAIVESKLSSAVDKTTIISERISDCTDESKKALRFLEDNVDGLSDFKSEVVKNETLIRETLESWIAKMASTVDILRESTIHQIQVSTDVAQVVNAATKVSESMKSLILETGTFQMWLNDKMDDIKDASNLLESFVKALSKNNELKAAFSKEFERGLLAWLDIQRRLEITEHSRTAVDLADLITRIIAESNKSNF